MQARQTDLPVCAVAGLDEAGRGCLAGPVAAAAVILPPAHGIVSLADSKKLSARRRELLAEQIRSCAISWAAALIWPWKIDRINILQAALMAMANAARRLSLQPEMLLVDGNQLVPSAYLAGLQPLPKQQALIGGDATVPVISAASIIAKTFRDSVMMRLHARWPQYGFASHKGYGTKAHYEALARYGPCPMHRKTFRLFRDGA